MEHQSKAQFEQVSLAFIVENAHEIFSKTLLSTRAKVLLLGGFDDEKHAARAYIARTRPHIDFRKKLNEEDERFIRIVQQYASDTQEYVNWVRSEGGQPVWKEALVSYCTAFENCLKAIAIAFFLADRRADIGLNSQIIIPSVDLTKTRKYISDLWSAAAEEHSPKVRNFFESYIRSKPCAVRYRGLADEVAKADWDICIAAFKTRNVIVHNLGVMRSNENLGRLDLYATWEVELRMV